MRRKNARDFKERDGRTGAIMFLTIIPDSIPGYTLRKNMNSIGSVIPCL
jgi:hypothetical protein